MEIEHTLWIKTSMRLITGNSNNFFTTPGSIRCAKWKWRKENKKGLKKKKKKKKNGFTSFDRGPNSSRNRWLLILPSISHYRCLLIDAIISISDGNRVAGEASQGGEYRRSDLRVARSFERFRIETLELLFANSFQSPPFTFLASCHSPPPPPILRNTFLFLQPRFLCLLELI